MELDHFPITNTEFTMSAKRKLMLFLNGIEDRLPMGCARGMRERSLGDLI